MDVEGGNKGRGMTVGQASHSRGSVSTSFVRKSILWTTKEGGQERTSESAATSFRILDKSDLYGSVVQHCVE